MSARKKSPPPSQPPPPAPAGLSPSGVALWAGLAADLIQLKSGAEVDFVLLEQVLRQLDRVAEVRAVLAAAGPMVAGSAGQQRPHPLLRVEGQLCASIAAGLERLQLTPKKRSWRAEVSVAGRLVMP